MAPAARQSACLKSGDVRSKTNAAFEETAEIVAGPESKKLVENVDLAAAFRHLSAT